MGIFRRQRTRDRVIDLRDPRVPRPVAERTWGLPMRCPECHQPGYLDSIDPAREVMFQHCPSCWARWSTSRAEIDAAAVRR